MQRILMHKPYSFGIHMRLRQLEAFRATVIAGTVSAAAMSMRTTQPTVSRLLKQLEDETGLQLFRREKGRIHLTNEGMTFYRRVDKTLAAFADLHATARDLHNDAFRDIRIMATVAVSTTIVPEILAELVRRHPGIRAKLITLDNVSYFSARCETEFDIILGPKIGLGAVMEQVKLAEVDFICAMPAGHPLARKSVVTVDDLDGETIISLLDDETRVFLQHERLFQDRGRSLDVPILCHSSAAAYGLVKRGVGVALLEPFSAPMWERFGVVTRPFEPRLTYEFAAGLKPDALQTAAMSEVVQIAKAAFGAFETRRG